MATQIQLRRDTAANWTSTNPTLAQGEPGLETDTGKLKHGDGTTAWNSLAYQAAANIVDGTIVNADVNSSAAIAGTKVSPSFGDQDIVTTGNLTLNAQGDLRFGDSDSSNYVAFQAPATVASDVTWTLPDADGTANQVLSTNGSGTLSWATGGGGGTKIEVGNTSAEVVDTGSDGHFKVTTEGSERLRVNSSGNVGIGTTSPGSKFDISSNTNNVLTDVNSASNYHLYLKNPDNANGQAVGLCFGLSNGNDIGASIYHLRSGANSFGSLIFATKPVSGSNQERARIDSSGRLLVGTSSARNNFFNTSGLGGLLQVEGANNNAQRVISHVYGVAGVGGPMLALGKHRGNSVGDNTVVQSGDECGLLSFQGSDGTEFVESAQIRAEVDGTPGANDMPGRLVFSTTADGASSPTERMRITNNGVIGVGDTAPASNAIRASFRGPVNPTESALPVVSIRRLNNAGGGTGVPETGLDVQIPNTFNSAGEVKGINVFATHNLFGAAYGIFAEAGGVANGANRYSGYFKITQPDTNGSGTNFAVYAQANANITTANNGFSIGVTSETSNYTKNQNFRAISLYTGADTQTVLSIFRNSSAIGSITTTTTATAYNTSSDYRLKENVVPLTGAVDRLQQIPVHRFNFIADPDNTVDGFLAHEAQEIVPECVTGTKDEVDADGNPVYQGIDQSKLVPLLTAALQEAIGRIETLEAEVTALKAQ
jgi:hypothetical protein